MWLACRPVTIVTDFKVTWYSVKLRRRSRISKILAAKKIRNLLTPLWFARHHVTCILRSHLIKSRNKLIWILAMFQSNKFFKICISYAYHKNKILKVLEIMHFHVHVPWPSFWRTVMSNYNHLLLNTSTSSLLSVFLSYGNVKNQFVLEKFMPTFNCVKLSTMKGMERKSRNISTQFFVILSNSTRSFLFCEELVYVL